MKTTESKSSSDTSHVSNPTLAPAEKDSFFSAGKQESNSFFGPHFIQPKLKIGKPNDKYEQEADRVADQVMRMPEPQLQRKCEKCEEEEKLQKKAEVQTSGSGESVAGPQLSNQIKSKSGTGNPLPNNVRSEMGHKMGADFSDLNIHTDSKSHQLNRQLGARAFTHGRDIYFNEGEYSPDSRSGKRLLVHELTHVKQQSNNSIQKQSGDELDSNIESRINYNVLEDKAVWLIDQGFKHPAKEAIKDLANYLDDSMETKRWQHIALGITGSALGLTSTILGLASNPPGWLVLAVGGGTALVSILSQNTDATMDHFNYINNKPIVDKKGFKEELYDQLEAFTDKKMRTNAIKISNKVAYESKEQNWDIRKTYREMYKRILKRQFWSQLPNSHTVELNDEVIRRWQYFQLRMGLVEKSKIKGVPDRHMSWAEKWHVAPPLKEIPYSKKREGIPRYYYDISVPPNKWKWDRKYTKFTGFVPNRKDLLSHIEKVYMGLEKEDKQCIEAPIDISQWQIKKIIEVEVERSQNFTLAFDGENLLSNIKLSTSEFIPMIGGPTVIGEDKGSKELAYETEGPEFQEQMDMLSDVVYKEPSWESDRDMRAKLLEAFPLHEFEISGMMGVGNVKMMSTNFSLNQIK